jgi:2',3'-cyclic-nucleotide 2'-phosphodiesterase / 3'-nucleotidase
MFQIFFRRAKIDIRSETMQQIIQILYTSDVHGRLIAYDYAKNITTQAGLTRLKTWLQTLKHPYILLDNGDLLQGSPLLDFHREQMPEQLNPAALVINELKYDAVTLGNHDFNYGQNYLNGYVGNLNCPLVCCNILNEQNENVYRPYHIFNHHDIKIGLIGAVTSNVPNWEQPNHIKGLKFEDAYLEIKKNVELIKDAVDIVVVLYHGGIEKDLITHELMGVQGIENQGYLISSIPEIDVLLTGHQHLPIVQNLYSRPLVMQVKDQAVMVGSVTLELEKKNQKWEIMNRRGELIDLCTNEDSDLLDKLDLYHQKTKNWLSKPIGKTQMDMEIIDPFQARLLKNPIFEWINHLQFQLTNAMISVSSLPNQAPGFKNSIALNDLSANFIFPNILMTLEISGQTLKSALERNAMYFILEDGKIKTNPSYLYPKEEHYNYDIYDGIEYTIDVRKPFGERIVNLKYQDNDIKSDDRFTIVMNNYRATGGGQFPMYASSKMIKRYEISMFDLAKESFDAINTIDFKSKKNIHIIY